MSEYGGRRYYDALTERCAECGWHAEGEYPDGRKYDACERYGYILHEPKEADCRDARTPAQVEAYKQQLKKRHYGKNH